MIEMKLDTWGEVWDPIPATLLYWISKSWSVLRQEWRSLFALLKLVELLTIIYCCSIFIFLCRALNIDVFPFDHLAIVKQSLVLHLVACNSLKFNSIQICYWIKCINLIIQYPMGLHIRHSLCKWSPSITKDSKYNDKNK